MGHTSMVEGHVPRRHHPLVTGEPVRPSYGRCCPRTSGTADDPRRDGGCARMIPGDAVVESIDGTTPARTI